MADFKYMPGDYMKLGVTKQGKDTNFAVAVGDTDVVLLKLYKNATDSVPETVITMYGAFRTGNIFSVCIKNAVLTGFTYLYEAKGVSFIDPYARLISGREIYGKMISGKARKLIRAYVCENKFDWKDDKAPGIDFSDLIIYKLHVRGFTKNTGVAHKGSYRGVTEKLPYLKELGINAVLLMPTMEYNEVYSAEPEVGVPEFVSSRFFKGNEERQEGPAENLPPDEINPMGASAEELPFINEKSAKVNYWGYTSFYHFFAPKASYASNPAKADYEFKQMVYKLHEAGIEVLMEVSIPKATNRSMMLDALRYWVREYHIDGFRLNLDNIDDSLIACDPYLSGAKLIGNKWNIDNIYPRQYSPDSKKLGIYNDAYSVEMRKFLKSDEGMSGRALYHVSENSGKSININYITDHNGFTLSDLYMYDIKHNDANGEHGRDGTDQNHSWNCGVEGPDKHKKIRELRLRMRKNAMAILLLSQGVPLIFAGDEFGNSQNGNNNAYCQDNEIGWVSWKKNKDDAELLEFVKMMIKLRKEHPVFHNRQELKKLDHLGVGLPDVSYHSLQAWYPDNNFYNRCIGVLLAGDYALRTRDELDESFYLAINMYWDEKDFEIPHLPGNREWCFEISTDKRDHDFEGLVNNATISVPGRSITLLKSRLVEVPKSTKRKRNKASEKQAEKPVEKPAESLEIIKEEAENKENKQD